MPPNPSTTSVSRTVHTADDAICVANPAAANTNLITARPGWALDGIEKYPRAYIANMAGNLSFTTRQAATLTFPAIAGVLYPLGNGVTLLAATTTATQVLVMW